LLVDCDSSVEKVLTELGLNVRTASFGKPYKVPATTDFVPIIGKFLLPNASEQEIIVVDLQAPPSMIRAEGATLVPQV
jgi:hypothetical protein